jgi:MMP 1-O-methyltransferase
LATFHPEESLSLKEARELASRTEGWLRGDEGEALFGLASSCRPPGVIVEIGSYKGKSTTWIAMGSRSGPDLMIYAVDPHGRYGGRTELRGDFQDFMANMKRSGIEDLVVPIVMTSVEAASVVNDRVAFLFVDGNHGYENVKLEIKLWSPKLMDGTHLAFHDAVGNGHAGVHRAVREEIYRSGRFRNVSLVGSMVICEKGRDYGIRHRSRTMLALCVFEVSDLPLERYLPGPVLRRVRRVLRRLR